MNILLLAFVVGAMAATHASTLPSPWLFVATAPVALACGLRERTRWLAVLWCGYCYALSVGAWRLAERVPAALVGQDLTLVGAVVSLPERSGPVTRFRFRLEDSADAWAEATLVLSVYGDLMTPHPGERWRVTARLDRPRGNVNPGLFDYDGWLLAENIGGRGYVRADPRPQRLAAARSLMPAIRERIRDFLRERIPDADMSGLLIALAIGESNAIGQRNWQVLSATGTNHLLIISGLHVGLIAAAGWQAGQLLFRRRTAAGMMSMTAAVVYGGIAGMGLPVQRALIMAAIALVAIVLNRTVRPSQLICLSLFIVTAVNPFAVLSAGYWLSFGAVFALLYTYSARTPVDVDRQLAVRLRELAGSQWVVFVGTTPLLLWQVHQLSLVAMAANLVAIPWVGITVIPPLLAALPLIWLAPALSEWLLSVAATSAAMLWRYLQMLADMRLIAWSGTVEPADLLLALAGACVVLAPGRPLPRWTGLVLMLPLLTHTPAELAPGEMRVTALDVGQGLAVIVQTRDTTLLYDAGARYGERFDVGEQIVLPSLRQRGVRRQLDAFIISHPDNDHAGGAPAIFRHLLVGHAIASEAVRPGVALCDGDRRWRQGETVVVVRAILPVGSDNDRSCVAWMRNEHFAVLLPGDIERRGEFGLMNEVLPAFDVMLVPHHGSRTSSSPAFLNHLDVRLAIVSAGYGNAFGHPDEMVMARYRARGIELVNTAVSGAVTVHLEPGKPARVERARLARRRFWYD